MGIMKKMTGMFQRQVKPRKPLFMTTMICIDCHHMWDASNISFPCPKCASKEVVAASRWQPDNTSIPSMGMGKAGVNG